MIPDTNANNAPALTAFEDLKGLAVHDAQDLLTGHLFGVLTESETGLIRFLDIELDGKGRHVLVPVGHARLEEGVTGRRIRLRAASFEDLTTMPAFTHEQAMHTHDAARELLSSLGKVFRGDRYYAHPAYNHHGLYAGEHPIVPSDQAGATTIDTLEVLSESREFKLASGEPDVRGWRVIDANGTDAGGVADLIIDTADLKVRYVVVHTEKASVLLPIGYVDFVDRTVRIPGLAAADIAALPPFDDLPLTRAAEEKLIEQIDQALDARNPFLRPDFSQHSVVRPGT